MIGRLSLLVIAACLTACTAGPRATPLYEPKPVKPEGCGAVGTTWKLKVKFDTSSGNRGAAKDVEPEIAYTPPINARELVVQSCDNVRFKVRPTGSAMVVFDKNSDPSSGFASPGKQPAYISRRGFIIVPIDKRDPPGAEYPYSIHVDCPDEDSECRPLDPMIKVER